MRYLVLNSLLFFFFASCTSSKTLVPKNTFCVSELSDTTQKNNMRSLRHFWIPALRDTTKKNDFRITISTPKANFTGIFIVKQMDDKWKGSIINEFGIKVCDFESNPKKCKLLNVITFLDKGYIKKEIASDIQFILEIDNPNYSLRSKATKCWFDDTFIVNYKNKKELRRLSNEAIEYENLKRKLTYSFVKINEKL